MAEYLVGFLLSLVLAGISYALSFIFNPVTMLFVHAAVHGFSGMGTLMWTSIFWPLTLAPLHWANYRLLHGNHWTHAGWIAGTGFLLAFIVLLKKSGPASS